MLQAAASFFFVSNADETLIIEQPLQFKPDPQTSRIICLGNFITSKRLLKTFYLLPLTFYLIYYLCLHYGSKE